MYALQVYNEKMKCWKDEGDENAPLPAPVVIFEKYRARLLPISELPILQNHPNIESIGLSATEAIVIDSKIAKTFKKHQNLEQEEEEDEFAMDTTENIENGPLHTSFVTLSKLKARNGHETEEDLAGFECVEFFDCNPIDISEAMSLEAKIRKTPPFDIEKPIPIIISTKSPKKLLSSIAWKIIDPLQKLTGITRILGVACNETRNQVVQLNGAFPSQNYPAETQEFRATYQIKRAICSQKRRNPGEVVVDIKWCQGTASEFLASPPNSAVCTVKVDLGWADTRFFRDVEMYGEVMFILNLADVLANPQEEIKFIASNPENLRAELDELIQEGSRKDQVFGITAGELEITEKLWKILYKSANIEQAADLLRIFFTALNFGSISSRVHYNNRSRLAQLIHSSKSGNFRIPRLEKLNTVEMIMEIGTEYLKRKLIQDFSTKIQLSQEELEMTMTNCEREIRRKFEEAESRAIAILPIAMSLATIEEFVTMINKNSEKRIPDIARKIIAEHVSSTIAQLGQSKFDFKFEQRLEISSLSSSIFESRRPTVWRCETRKSQGKRQVARLMTCLNLEMSLEEVNEVVNSQRPAMRELSTVPGENSEKARKIPVKSNSDYTVSHTIFSYY
ncbi:unnamed protein product [Caenorhabditis angaria]|uniref:Protein zwilch n=1 Tax=Caenorhabditis angaria TaxID=860376 RepID=A0A9P1I6E1_9PELO|nr:unnamed protein product [Caenorhabditis angaria]